MGRIKLISFGMKHRKLDKVVPESGGYFTVDCRLLNNPHFNQDLKDKTGLESDVQAYVSKSPDWENTLDKATEAMTMGLPVIAFCVGGKHRSVAVIDVLSKRAKTLGIATEVKHLEL